MKASPPLPNVMGLPQSSALCPPCPPPYSRSGHAPDLGCRLHLRQLFRPLAGV